MNRIVSGITTRILKIGATRLTTSHEKIPANDYLLPEIKLNEIIGFGAPQSICILSSQIERPQDMVLPLGDLLSVAAICRHCAPQRVMEIGTFTGETTWTMARNLPEESKILTLDLPPDQIPQHFAAYAAGSAFSNTPEALKIQQLYGWSQSFDFSPYYGKMDLVFIDGDHSFDAVRNDTEHALKLAKQRGIIVWDDYRFLNCHESCRGVSEYLHSAMNLMPVRQLCGTRLAIMAVD